MSKSAATVSALLAIAILAPLVFLIAMADDPARPALALTAMALAISVLSLVLVWLGITALRFAIVALIFIGTALVAFAVGFEIPSAGALGLAAAGAALIYFVTIGRRRSPEKWPNRGGSQPPVDG